jgi:leader peptidase (prepilin peptidase)/N-methyltransferase
MTQPAAHEPPLEQPEPTGSLAMPPWAIVAALLLAAATVARLGFSANSVAWAVVQVVLVGVAAYDLAHRRVKNVITIPLSVVAVLLRVLFERSALAEVVIAGLVICLVFFALSLFLRGGLGMGDVKLAGMLGLYLGRAVAPAILIALISGVLVGAVIIARKGAKEGRKTAVPFGPFLALGGMIAFFVGNELVDAYLDTF